MNIIVAAAENGAIGNKGQMPWHLSSDLKYFKQTTLGRPVIMGRKTFESIGRPLPGRHNVIVTRDLSFALPAEVMAALKPDTTVRICHSLKEALEAEGDEAFVIGGAQIYREAWPLADRIYLTRVHTEVAEFDAVIPPIPEGMILEIVGAAAADEKNDYPVTFEVWHKER